jgi:hypothetical protein
MNFVRPIATIYSKGFKINLFHIFPSFIQFLMNFLSLNEFPEIEIRKLNLEFD